MKIQDRYIVSQEVGCGSQSQQLHSICETFKASQSTDLGRRFRFRDQLHLCFEENDKQRVDREVHEPTR